MKAFHLGVALLVIMLLLTGCWNQSHLRDKVIINGITFDALEEDPDIIQTNVRALNIQSSGGGKFNIKDEMLTSEGKNVNETDIKLTNELFGEMDISKAFVVVIGEELAKSKGVLPILNPIARSSYGYISSKVMIAEGRGMDILSIQMDYSPIAFRILNMFRYAEKRTHIPNETAFSIWNKVTDKEQDALIPLVRKSGPNLIEISGTALFNGDNYTGYSLSTEQSTLLLLMLDRFNLENTLNIDNEETKPFGITIESIQHEEKLRMIEGKDGGEFDVNIKVYAELNHYEGSLSEKDLEKLNKIASDYLNEKSEAVTKILKEANSDVLGIQKKVSSQYPEYMKNKDWKDIYNQIQIKPDFSVQIMSSPNLK
ncbi:Ger(x)C family spore germination protein [Cytobacillus oceanisediminis]|uniref:Ger(x)C family spore germination protein n=1 Tax=Cytobacillus oceanisediminis TaxID=665099 RepID=UPI0023DA7EC2|nr:Ger(x)C family spore germination protein [Cytobacillus oceanisediminis]MDF2038403.1 Ger(x)C family spore germination protein [Cytobacillus oceanisediminis]